MKVIFLDIDGVLNSDEWYNKKDINALGKSPDDDIDDDALGMLINYIEKHNIKVVISSSWRCNSLTSTLKFFSKTKLSKLCPYIVGVTPYGGVFVSRGQEIDLYINSCKDTIEEYAIIDDEDLFQKHQKDHLVRTSYAIGLTQADLQKCSKILKLDN